MFSNILWIGVGGGIGSIARYLTGRLAVAQWGSAFPYGTLLVNIMGCFLIGLFANTILRNSNEGMRLFLVTGFCGGFTTFSAFSIESIELIKQDRLSSFFIYVALSVILGLLATFGGMKLVN